MEPLKDNLIGPPSLKIVEKYGTFFRYVYPILITKGGHHKVLRDRTLDQLILQVGLFNDAAKSNQISKLYLADAGLSTIRDLLRILSYDKIRLLSLEQYGHATSILSEVGAITGEWIRGVQKRKGSDG